MALRKMSGAEVALARYAHDKGSWRVGSFIDLEGENANDDEKLRRVLAHLQLRHPLLRAVITVGTFGYSWEEDSDYRIPVHVEEGDKREAYFKHTQDSLKTGDGIMRCVLVKNEAEHKSTLIPLIDHFASDGMCYTNLIKEILFGLSDSPEFEGLSLDLDIPDSCEVYADRSFAGQFGKKTSVELRILPKLFSGMTHTKKPAKLEKNDGLKNEQVFVFDSLSPEDSKLLLQHCRKHETTITGLVGAVFAEVYSKLVQARKVEAGKAQAGDEAEYKISQSLAFDLRRLYKPNIAREGVSFHVGFGMPINLSTKTLDVSNEDTWRNARLYKEKLAKDQNSGITVGTALLAGYGIPILLGSGMKYCDFFFTNWGLLPIKTEYNGLKVTDFVGLINSIKIPFPIIIASSFDKKLGFTIQAPRSKFDEAFIQQFSRGILDRIESVIHE